MTNSADPDQLASEKPTDLDLHCLQRQGISGFSSARNRQKQSFIIVALDTSFIQFFFFSYLHTQFILIIIMFFFVTLVTGCKWSPTFMTYLLHHLYCEIYQRTYLSMV